MRRGAPHKRTFPYETVRPTEDEIDAILLIQEIELNRQREHDRASLHPAYGRGLHSDRWPFDISRCIADEAYRTEVCEAISNDFYNKHWRAKAAYDYKHIVMPRLFATARKNFRLAASIGELYGVPLVQDPEARAFFME